MIRLTDEEKQVGVHANDRDCQLATIPFTITFDMPRLDSRTRGYLPTYIKELQETVGSEW